jgi:hypothetical protein
MIISKPGSPTDDDDNDDNVEEDHERTDDDDETQNLFLQVRHGRLWRVGKFRNFTKDRFVTSRYTYSQSRT